MAGVVRLGDKCTGHDGYPPRSNITASPNVFINGKGVHRQGDKWAVHCKKSCHDGVLVRGSSTVFVNGKQIARKGDPINCGSRTKECSSDVFSG